MTTVTMTTVTRWHLLALFAFLTTVTGQSERIQVDVYYESLCSDSMRWVRDQLVPSYPILKDFLNVTFVPYGKALHTRDEESGEWRFSCQHGTPECEGNMAQACGIHAIQVHEAPEDVQRLTVDLVGCAMSSRYPPTAVPQCAQTVGLSTDTQKTIQECRKGSLGGELLAANGERTKALNPSLTFVPTISINGVHSQNQREALNGFLGLICGQLPTANKPAQCV